jgi:hypothetical protein
MTAGAVLQPNKKDPAIPSGAVEQSLLDLSVNLGPQVVTALPQRIHQPSRFLQRQKIPQQFLP